jgi:hypothetical protein
MAIPKKVVIEPDCSTMTQKLIKYSPGIQQPQIFYEEALLEFPSRAYRRFDFWFQMTIIKLMLLFKLKKGGYSLITWIARQAVKSKIRGLK